MLNPKLKARIESFITCSDKDKNMPFPQIAKDNFVVTLSLADLFTDSSGRYLSLNAQMASLQEVQRCLNWQAHNLYQPVNAGRNEAKQTLIGYLRLESTVDFFMRYMPIPACQIHDNLAYLNDKVQELIYQNFKHDILRKALQQFNLPSLSVVDDGIKKMVKEKVLGYSKRLADQSREEWQLFVAEIDVGIEVLSKQYRTILTTLHSQFFDFRKGYIAFAQNYYDRCMFLAKLEEWLALAPFTQASAPLTEAKFLAFCGKLQELEARQKERDVQALFASLAELQKATLTQGQFKQIAQTLIALKPKYDAYRAGQELLTAEAQLEQWMAIWPKPKLPRLIANTRKEADDNWEKLRAQHREQKEVANDESESSLKHKKPLNVRKKEEEAAASMRLS
jgi:hypothetical protein